MKKIIYLIISLITLSFTGCSEDEKGSYPPVYCGFSYEPSVVHPGDVITITAVQEKKGHYLNATDYAWTMKVMLLTPDGNAEEVLENRVHTNYGGQDSNNPRWEVTIPSNTIPGNYTCTFNAQWSNSADGIGGTYSAGTGEGCVGTINSYSYTLYSKANGSFRLSIQ